MSGKAKELLKEIGFKSADIDNLLKEDGDANVSEMANAYKQSQKENYKAVLRNDAEFVDELHKAATGKYNGTLESAFKSAGLDKDELRDEDGNLKAPKELVGLLNEKLTADYNNKAAQLKEGGSEDIKKLQEQLREKEVELKKLRDEELPNAVKQAEAKADNFIINTKMREQFLSVPADELSGKKHSDGIYRSLLMGLKEKYDIRLNENQELALYQKGTDMQVNTEDGTRQMTVNEAVYGQLKADEFIVQNNGGEHGEKKGSPGAPAGQAPKGNLTPSQMRAKELDKSVA